MSSQDVEKLQAWLKTWDLEALAAGELDYSLIDPEVVYEDAILPDHAGEAYRGYDGLTRAARVWLGPFEEVSIELERVVSVGDHIVSVHLFRGKFRHPAWSSRGRSPGCMHSGTEGSPIGGRIPPLRRPLTPEAR